MDTITYLADPADKTRMVSVITDLMRFTHQYVHTKAPVQADLYDQYDKANDCTAQSALLNSLDPVLHIKIKMHIPDKLPS